MVQRTIILLCIFAAAMGLLETIVVVYLRELYYPGGFSFPLAAFSPRLYGIELLREFATLVMLLGIALLAGRGIRFFAWFLLAFAVWDIAYYLGLKLLLGWPSSFLTWDILFLIPWAWVGPVLAPLICCVMMILLALLILKMSDAGTRPVLSRNDWLILVGGALLILYAFLEDYGLLLYRSGLFGGLEAGTEAERLIAAFIPQRFNWLVFLAGSAFILLVIGRMWHRYKRTAG
ncbi:MAG TPA: hypothetical protein P5531_02785 [Bacteroidales bacterium]|nr:hypothetical protein [Bacteroidales bacterium]HSA42555.1 hypothetical protein [Bacteroidales bacterium]